MVSDNLKRAVAARDVRAVRDCLAACIVFDTNLTRSFPESLKYCLDNGIAESELYERHDGRSLDREATMDSFSALCGELGTNFSRERIDAIRRIGRILNPPSGGDRLAEGAHRTQTEPSSTQGKSLLPLVGLAVGGMLVGGVVGGLVLKKALAGAIVGGVAGFAAGQAMRMRRSPR